MKKVVLAAAGSLLFVTAASAADMAPRYTKAPVVVPVYNWGGLYLGINGGGGSAHTCWDIFNDSGFPIVPSVPEGCHNATGATVGGQIGYRWQATNWVFGLEAQGNWADFRGSNASQYAVFGTTSLLNDVTKVDAFGLFTGQVGYAFNNVLLYAKGGAAVVHDKYSLTLTPAGAAALRAVLRRRRRPDRCRRLRDALGRDRRSGNSSSASRRAGLSLSNTIICSWAAGT